MYKPKFFVFAIILFAGINGVFAQTDEKNPIESSYEVTLQVLVASNAPSSDRLPASLSAVIKKLKSEYSFTNYNLAATYLERISTSGGVDHKGLLNQLGQNQGNDTYFTDWSLNGLRTAVDAKNQNLIQFQSFRFGARVPVVVQVQKDAKGDDNRVINYESIGVNVNRFNLPENVPTIVGSLSTQKTDEFVFLVLTVKSVQ